MTPLAQTSAPDFSTSSSLQSDDSDFDSHHRPMTPEPSTYGMIFVGLSLVIFLLVRSRKQAA